MEAVQVEAGGDSLTWSSSGWKANVGGVLMSHLAASALLLPGQGSGSKGPALKILTQMRSLVGS